MRTFLVTSYLSVLCLSSSVSGADVEVWKEKLSVSQKAWDSACKMCAGNYAYNVTTEYYSGTVSITTVVVRDNKVIERRLVKGVLPQGKPSGTKPINTVTEWVETTADLGKHEGRAAKPKTIDELYAEARKLLNGPIAKHEQLTVSFDKEGLLKDCFVIDTRVADDDTRRGVSISQLTLGMK